MNLSTPKPTSSLTALALLVLSTTTVTSTAHADQTLSYTYNGLGLIETVDGPRADVTDITTFGYDTKGNRTAITNALGHVTQITAYDLSGRPLTIVDANGATTQLSYDVRGRLLSQNTAGRLTTFTYDAVGNVTQISQSNGQVINYQYDSAHRPTGYSDAQGNSVVYTLDLAGNQTQEKIYDPSNQLTRSHSFIYDELNRLRADIGADSQTATLDYDTNSNLTDQTDPNGNPTSYAFDGLNRLVDTTDADNGQTTYGYDDRDNLTSVTDPNGNTTTYSYDIYDNLIQQNSPDTGISTFTYDDANNRLTQTDANNITSSYSYDALNRLTSISYPNSDFNVTYTYDENNSNQHGIGRLTSQTDHNGSGAASGSTSYYYDIRGNLTNVTTQRDAHTLTLDYSYNTTDQLTQITYPDGRTVDYSYDTAGNISQVTSTDNQANTQTVLSAMQYQPFGPMTSQLFGNGVTVGKTIDQDYRQQSLSTLGILERAYNFDANSNIISISDLIEANNSQSFNYDNLNRLDDANSTHYGAIDYQYDATHNRTHKTTLINALTLNEDYQYAVDSNRLTHKTAGTVQNYQYDANGNITDNGHYQFTYGQDNRLHVVTQGGQTVAAYSYNAQGQRSLKIAGGTTTYYLYSPSGQLLTETDTLGQTQKNYLYANGQLVAIAQAGGSTTTELILDNLDASYSDNWPLSTSVQGYTNSNYQYHTKASGSNSGDVGTPIDNVQATYSDNWPVSTSINQYYGSNYQYHAGGTTTSTLGTPIDNLQASYVGSWPLSTSVSNYYETNYQFNAAGTGSDTATWTSNITTTASYDVYAYWTAAPNRASDAKYTINHTSGNNTVTVNQKQNGGQWNLLGTYTLDTASTVVLSDDANGYVIADGITILPAGTPPNPTTQSETATWQLNAPSTASYDVYAHWTAHANRASDAKYTINHTAGNDTVTVNQQQNGGQWNLLGTYTLNSSSTVDLSSDANGYVIADGITILPAGTPPTPTPPTFETATWTPNQAGSYEVYARWTAAPNRASDAKYTITHTAGSDTVTVNQTQNGNSWNLLGTYTLNGISAISLNNNADGYVIADGLKLVPTTATTTSGVFYVHNDHLGTPQAITDQSQHIVWQATYTPFGQATIITQTLENNIRFPGQYYDQETQLHYNYFRYYDPSLGRYITSDPIGLAGGVNTYGYAYQNSLKYIDPTGESTIIEAAVIIAAASYIYVAAVIQAQSTNGSSDNSSGIPPFVPGLDKPIDPWEDTTTNIEVPSNILPPKIPDQCESTYNQEVAACEASCNNFATKAACRAKAKLKLWICRGADKPSGSDGPGPGGSDFPGYTGF